MTPDQLKAAAEKKFPYDNGGGELMVRWNHRADQLRAAFIAGYQARDAEASPRWVKAMLDNLPAPEKRVIARWHHAGNPDWQRIDLTNAHQLRHWIEHNEVHLDSLEYLDESGQDAKEGEIGELKQLIETIRIMADGGKTDAYEKIGNILAIIDLHFR